MRDSYILGLGLHTYEYSNYKRSKKKLYSIVYEYIIVIVKGKNLN